MLIYIVRHGETNANDKGYLQGWSNDHLNENGRALAHITGKALRGIAFDECFSSTLDRAKETAEIILEESGNDIPIRFDDRIKEVNMGEWERLKYRPGEREVDAEAIRLFFGEPGSFPGFPGGETLGQLCERTQDFLKELIARNDDKTYLISTHGVALRAMLNMLYEDPDDFWHGHVPYNCAVNIIEVNDGEARLIGDDKIYYDNDKAVDQYAVY